MKAPTPVKGWRLFLGEVGVIVLGVLIALGAQQAVEEIRIRGDVRTFRETIDHEISLNLYVYDFRSRQVDCVKWQIDELNDWLAQARAGKNVPGINGNSPFALSPYRSAWENKDADVFANLPYAVRLKYAEFYDELSNNMEIRLLEVKAWNELATYREPGPITLGDRRKIRSVLGAARSLNALLPQNLEVSRKIATDLGIKPRTPDNIPQDFFKRVLVCGRMLAKD